MRRPSAPYPGRDQRRSSKSVGVYSASLRPAPQSMGRTRRTDPERESPRLPHRRDGETPATQQPPPRTTSSARLSALVLCNLRLSAGANRLFMAFGVEHGRRPGGFADPRLDGGAIRQTDHPMLGLERFVAATGEPAAIAAPATPSDRKVRFCLRRSGVPLYAFCRKYHDNRIGFQPWPGRRSNPKFGIHGRWIALLRPQ